MNNNESKKSTMSALISELKFDDRDIFIFQF